MPTRPSHAGPSRNRHSVASESQAQSRRRRRDEEDEPEQLEVEAEDEAEAEADAGLGGLKEEEVRRAAAKFVRFALGMEFMKKPVRRSDLSKYCPNQRAFPHVLARAQQELKRVFGMELVELRPRWKTGDDDHTPAPRTSHGRQALNAIDEEDEEGRGEGSQNAQTQAVKKKKPSTGMYILKSTLPIGIVERMSDPLPIPLENPPAGHDADSGALLNWEKGDGTASGHVAMLGIRTLVLCLVMCNGRVITDDHLHSLLRRLDLHRETLLPFYSTSSRDTTPLTLDKYLDLLDKQLYLQKVKTPTPGADATHSVEWRWGQREVEFSEKAAAKFIENIMFEGEEEEDEQEDPPEARRAAGTRRRREEDVEENGEGRRDIRKEKRRLAEDLRKAAGGELTGGL